MKKTDTAALIAKYAKSLAAGKKAYKHADACLDSIVSVMKPGDVAAATNGRKFQLIDEFAQKTVVFKPCGVRRYKLEEVSEP